MVVMFKSHSEAEDILRKMKHIYKMSKHLIEHFEDKLDEDHEDYRRIDDDEEDERRYRRGGRMRR